MVTSLNCLLLFFPRKPAGISHSVQKCTRLRKPTFAFMSPHFSRLLLLCHSSQYATCSSFYTVPWAVQFFFFSYWFSLEKLSVWLLPFLFQNTGEWRSGKQARPNTSESGRGGKSCGQVNNFLTSSLLSVFLSPLTKKGEEGFMKRLPESASQSELRCQVCPMVGTALRNSTGGRALAGKLLLLLYLHGRTRYPQRVSLQRCVSFSHRRFFKSTYSFWVSCVYLRFSLSGSMSSVRGCNVDWEGVGGWTCHHHATWPPGTHLGAFPSVTVSTPFPLGFQGVCVAAALRLSWPANLIIWSFWETVPSGMPMVLLTFGIENICHVTFTLKDS